MMKRRKEREFILQILYAFEYDKMPWGEIIDKLAPENLRPITPFIGQVLELCTEKAEELDSYYTKKLENWDFGRVAIIDRLLLRIALAEFIYCKEIPPEVTLNEIIEISKNFSTDKSGKFLNGILDAVLKEFKSKKIMKKAGRGLALPSKQAGKITHK